MEQEIVKDVVKVEKVIVKDVVSVARCPLDMQVLCSGISSGSNHLAPSPATCLATAKRLVSFQEDVEQEIVVEAKKVFSFGK